MTTWYVDVTALLRWPGSTRDVEVELALEDAMVADTVADRVEGVVHLESLTDGIRATGTVVARWQGICRRCLEEMRGSTDVAVDEIFERRPTEGETHLLDDHRIDLGTMLREATLLELPLAPLCDPACAGPAPESYPARPGADDDTDHHTDHDDHHTGHTAAAAPADDRPPKDPRWAALDALAASEEHDPGEPTGNPSAARE